eukprot:9580037-Alexandrium_andersonii.AAC.1
MRELRGCCAPRVGGCCRAVLRARAPRRCQPTPGRAAGGAEEAVKLAANVNKDGGSTALEGCATEEASAAAFV